VSKISKLDGELRIYLIGSAVNSANPNDIDLVIVFNDAKTDIDDVLACRRQLKNDGPGVLGMTLDICLLSHQEAKTNPFLKDEDAVLIYG